MEKPPGNVVSKRHRARGNLYRKFASKSSDRAVPKGPIRPKRIRPCACGLRQANGAHLGAIIARKPRLGSDPPENPVSYRPPPQNRFLAVTEKPPAFCAGTFSGSCFLGFKPGLPFVGSFPLFQTAITTSGVNSTPPYVLF